MKILYVEAVPAAIAVWPRNVGIDGLRASRRLGITSIVATGNREFYGSSLDGLVDMWYPCETTSAEAVAEAARAVGADLVFSWVDAFVPVAAQAAELLGLERVANSGSPACVRDKSQVRRQLDSCGVRNARWEVIDLRSGAAALKPLSGVTGYPAIIKPVDGTGGRDVLHIPDEAALAKACAAHLSRSDYGHHVVPAHRMICEQLLDGELVSVEGMAINGLIEIWGYTDRRHTGQPAYVEIGFAFAGNAFTPTLDDYARQVVKALGYSNGCFHMEIVLTAEGPVLVEFNPRIASGIYQCIDLATGRSTLEEMLRGLFDISAGILPPPAVAACRTYLLAPGDGVLRGVAGIAEALSVPGVTDVSVKTSAKLLPGAADRRVGYVQAVGATRAESRASTEAAIALLTPILEPGRARVT
jgi:cysteine synthase A